MSSDSPRNEQPPLDTEERPEPEEPHIGRKFYTAMAAYAVLAISAGLTLDGNLRLVVWVFVGALAVKTYLVTQRKP